MKADASNALVRHAAELALRRHDCQRRVRESGSSREQSDPLVIESISLYVDLMAAVHALHQVGYDTDDLVDISGIPEEHVTALVAMGPDGAGEFEH